MWIAADIAKDYTIAISKNNLPAAKKIESIGAAVGKINFLLDRGLEQDRSLPLSEVRLVPPSLQKTKLEDMKRALIGAYHHLASKGADGEKRAYHLYMAHAASEKPNSFLSPMWSASRKTEALYEAASALKEKYEAANPPRVEDCEISHDFCRAAQESIGLGVYNYSDVTKSAGKTLVDQIESDLTNVFGADAGSIKKRRTQKPELAALWARIASPLDVPAEPEWVSGILPLD